MTVALLRIVFYNIHLIQQHQVYDYTNITPLTPLLDYWHIH